MPESDLERLPAAWQESVFAMYLAEGKIEPRVVDNMRTWPHSSFSADRSVFLPAHDRAGRRKQRNSGHGSEKKIAGTLGRF